MNQSEENQCVAVWFSTAIPLEASSSKRAVISNRHVIEATRLLQDSTTSTFIDPNGEVVATYPTALIIDVEWLATPEQRDDRTTQLTANSPPAPTSDQADLKNLAPGSSEWRDAVSTLYPHAYKPWTFKEDEQLRRECADGLTIREIAQRHERRPGGISSRINHLEIER